MASVPPKADLVLREGDVLAGRYRLIARIGEGGMGMVWEGRQITTDKRVAIKVLKGRDQADAARFLREAKVAAGLAHRNIVQVFDFWEVAVTGPVFMVMEMLVGQTLAAHLEHGRRLPLDEMIAIVLPVASAVRASHAQGIVHRDLKPENIFLAQSSPQDPVDVKVLDFGLARPVTSVALSTAITQTGSIMGTPFYMSPEQVYGEKDIDVRADIWALGVVVYECLSGTKPFMGENLGQLFKRLTEAKFRPLREAAPNVPPALDALVTRMLSHERSGRPSIDEVCAWFANPQASIPPPSTTQRLPSTPAFEAAPSPIVNPRYAAPAIPAATMVGATTSVHGPPSRKVAGVVGIGVAVVAVAAAAAIGGFIALRPAKVNTIEFRPSVPDDVAGSSTATAASSTAIPSSTTTTTTTPIPTTTTIPTSSASALSVGSAVNYGRSRVATPSSKAAPRAVTTPTPPHDPLSTGRF
jgi:serine/threonine protein kinase